jgi:hypothetical protein
VDHAYRLTASWSLAEDLTASTFLTAWRRCTDITLVRDSALPWLYTVAGDLARSAGPDGSSGCCDACRSRTPCETMPTT